MKIVSANQSEFLPPIELDNKNSISSGEQNEAGFHQLFELMADWFSPADHDQAKESMHALYFRTADDAELTGHFNQLEELAGEAWKENFQLTESSEGVSRTLDLSSVGEKSIHLEEKNPSKKEESQSAFSKYLHIGYGLAIYHIKSQITPQNLLTGGWAAAKFLFEIPLTPLQKDLVGHSFSPLLSLTSAAINYFSIDVSEVLQRVRPSPKIWA